MGEGGSDQSFLMPPIAGPDLYSRAVYRRATLISYPYVQRCRIYEWIAVRQARAGKGARKKNEYGGKQTEG